MQCNGYKESQTQFLTHNRPIHIRTDDSVIKLVNNSPFSIRRARGYAPDAIILPYDSPSVFAAGAELKNTFCFTQKKLCFPKPPYR